MTDEPATRRTRREILWLLGSLGAGVVLAACGGSATRSIARSLATSTSGSAATPGSTSGPSSATSVSSCARVPTETGGPYPGDGSNGPNVLTQSGVVRSDIRSSLGSGSTTAEGVPLTIALSLVDASNGCVPLSGAAVYVWHCDRDGRYSMYSPGVTNETFLRGVQASDRNGRLQFTSVFPAAYSGRWPHIHFQVYPSTSAATNATGKLVTSQIALPEDVCRQVYATSGYSQSVTNLNRTSLSSDLVFSDGYSLQMATLTGSPSSGYTASLVVAV